MARGRPEPAGLTGWPLLAVVLVAMGAGVFAFMHYGDRPRASAAISSADLPAATRNSAAAWVARQVASADVVACDPVMCRALETHGMPAARLRVLWPGTDNLAGSAVVVATPAVQSHLGARAGNRGRAGNHREIRLQGPADRDPGDGAARGRGLPVRCCGRPF